jgi:hypothetical protein
VYLCGPTIPSVSVFIDEFLKHRGPKLQGFEDTYQGLLEALWDEGFLGLIECNEEIDDDEAFLEEEDSHGIDSIDIIRESEDFHADTSDCDEESAAGDEGIVLKEREDLLNLFEDNGVPYQESNLQDDITDGLCPESASHTKDSLDICRPKGTMQQQPEECPIQDHGDEFSY